MPGEPEPVDHGIGVLLVNLGTPDAADASAVRRYLKEFLTDRRVIENNSWAWKMLLNGLILPLRSRRKARDYQKIWNNEKNESPFKTITRSQAEKLSGILEPLGKHVIVDWAMRYANPTIASRLEGADQARLRPHPDHAALSAIRGGDDRNGVRRGFQIRHGAAAAAGACASCPPTTRTPITSRCCLPR